MVCKYGFFEFKKRMVFTIKQEKFYIIPLIYSKINTFALLQVMPYLEKDIFLMKFELILKQIIPDVHTFVENLQKFSENDKSMKLSIPRLLISQTRLNEAKPSLRKEEIRKTCSYDDINLKSLFLDKIKVFLEI